MHKKIATLLDMFLLFVLGASSIMEQTNKLLLSAKIIALVILAGILGWTIISMPSSSKAKTIVKNDNLPGDNNK